MSLLGYILLLTAALCCTAAPTGPCPRPERLTDAELQGDWNADSYPENTQAVYQCRPGYSRLGTIKRICLSGKWEVLSNGQCRKKSCGHPGDIPFGSFQLLSEDAFVFGAVVEYSCDDGYQMVSKEKRRQCTATGWNNYPPHCEVKNCPPVQAAENINVLSTSYDEEYSVGQVVRFECKNSNLKLDGPPEIFCTSEGNWNLEPPTCKEISCKFPDLANGRVNNPQKDVYKNNEVIQILCNEGFYASKNEVTCTKLDWNPTPFCNEIVCSPQHPVEKGRLDGKKAVYKYGEEIEVKCDEGYMLQSNPDKLRSCTANGWYPPARCVSKKCDRPDIKNGIIGENYYFPLDTGSYFYYRCEESYLTPLKTYYAYPYCTKDGWDRELKCLRSCLRPDIYVENAWIKYPQSKYLEGESATFQCHRDYTTSDGESDGKITCLPNGKFTSANCLRPCQAPETQHQKLNPNKFYYESGESLQYDCKEGYMTIDRHLYGTATCNSGTWSEYPTCTEILCIYGRNNFRNGDVIKYTCQPGKRPTSHEGQCFYYGWGPPPDCQDIVCTIPDTSDLIRSPHKAAYRLQTKVSFSCRDGFSRVGSSESVCREKDWNPPLPSCQEITCTISKENNLTKELSEKVFKENDKATVWCKTGFTKKKGSTKTTCTEKGWDPPLLTCEAENLVQPVTTNPSPEERQVENSHEPDSVAPSADSKDKIDVAVPSPDSKEKTAEISHEADSLAPPESKDKIDEIQVSSKPDVVPLDPEDNEEKRQKCPPPYSPKNTEIIDGKEVYYNNESITMKCVIGHKMHGSPVVWCIEGKWGQPPECIRLTACRNPPTIKNGYQTESSKQEKYVTGDIVTYSCKSGFHISELQSTCVNERWSTSPICTEDSCSDPPDVTYATVTETKQTYNHGEMAKYECKKGFTFSGQDSASCIEGQWKSIPNCVSTSCKRPPAVQNARLKQVKTSYASGEKVTYLCNAGYSLERSFTGDTLCENTQWKNLPVCRKIGEQCGPPPVVQFGDTLSIKKANYKSGESVEYKCPNFHVLQGNKKVNCQNGVWDEAPVCLEPCTAKEKDMGDNNIQLKWSHERKLYSEHGDSMTFVCKSGYEALPDTQMRSTCEHGKLPYPKCFRTGFCVLQQSKMIINNIHYNVSTVLDNGQTIVFQCNEGTMAEKKLEAKCENGNINYPKCSAAKSCTTPEIQNGFLKTEPAASYDSGSNVEFECVTDYVLNSPIRVDCKNGEWTDLPVCNGPCKISSEDLTKHNIQLLSSDDPKNTLDKNYKHGTELTVVCKPGYRRQGQSALVIECYDGKLKYPRCFSGKTCRIDQDGLDNNNLELDEVHNNEVLYEAGETIQFKCKSGFRHRVKPTGTCAGQTVSYPTCTAESSV